jgi:hypothetical protein
MSDRSESLLSSPNLAILFASLALAILALLMVWSGPTPLGPSPDSVPDPARYESQVKTLAAVTRVGMAASFILALLALAKSVFGWYKAKVRFSIAFLMSLFYFIILFYGLLNK